MSEGSTLWGWCSTSKGVFRPFSPALTGGTVPVFDQEGNFNQRSA